MKRFLTLTVLSLLLSPVALAEDKIGNGIPGNGEFDFPDEDINLGEETVFVDNVFAPKGFDANDKLEVIVSGWKSSPCIGKPKAYVEREGSDIKITVKAPRKAARDRLCIDMAVHFLTPLSIPKVPAGNYNLIVNAETSAPKFAKMEIAAPTNDSIDDFLYADVETVSVDAKTRTVEISGENSSPCVVLDRIVSISNGVNTYAIMPIMRKKDAICPQVLTPFKYSYRLPDDLHGENVLVHVRTLDGNSKNKVLSAAN